MVKVLEEYWYQNITMDKYDKHLAFLQAAFPEIGAEKCQAVFLDQAKRDVRKALFYLLQPSSSEEALLEKLRDSTAKSEHLDCCNQLLHWYCPNPSYKKVVGNLSKGKPLKIDTATLPRLKAFRRPPRRETLAVWFQIMDAENEELIVHFLKGLMPFGREVEPFWYKIDQFGKNKSLAVVRAALSLLAAMPTGIHKSIILFTHYCSQPSMRFYALSAMQQVTGIAPNLLRRMFDPIIEEYRRLAMTQGAQNDLWQEFRLVQNVLRNNGVVLSIPDINLGRF